MNVDAINADPRLKDTPIGAVSVMRLRNGDVVVLARKRGERQGRVVYTLSEGENIWQALYGKAFHERERFDAAQRALEAARPTRIAEARERSSAEFRAAAKRLFARYPDLLRELRNPTARA